MRSASLQRKIRSTLRTARKNRRLTLAEVASAVGCSITKIQRIETGKRSLLPDDVRILLEPYQVPAEVAKDLVDALMQVDGNDWWREHEVHPWLPKAWREQIPLEDEATIIYTYSPVIPDLLQIPAYTQALLSQMYPHLSDKVVGRLVGAQTIRQLILSRTPWTRLHCLIDEAALRRSVGTPGVQARQLEALAVAAELPNVTLRMVPLSAGAHPGVEGAATVFEFADSPAMARAAGSAGFKSTARIVAEARQAWETIQQRSSSEAVTTQALRIQARALLGAAVPTNPLTSRQPVASLPSLSVDARGRIGHRGGRITRYPRRGRSVRSARDAP